MEIKTVFHNRLLRGALLFGGLPFLLTGCAEGTAQVPSTDISQGTILDAPETVVVHPGEAAVLRPTQDRIFLAKLIGGIKQVDHIYPHGMEDKDAPTLAGSPLRLKTQVTLQGKSPVFANDLACDTVNVALERFPNKGQAYIGALALSKDKNSSGLIVWPRTAGGEVSSTFYVCFPKDNEPTEGVVLVASDQPR